ncbi:URK [Hepatospora eriocheir]|nr:URK [Hepatospora eriocheir]
MEKIQVYLVQGPSCSGKTTLSKYLYNKLISIDIPTVLLSTDMYYKTFKDKLTYDKIIGYDFDNPAALNWDALSDTFKAYGTRQREIPISSYSFQTKKQEIFKIDNIYPKVIILEGIYSFNLFSKKFFNIKEFS